MYNQSVVSTKRYFKDGHKVVRVLVVMQKKIIIKKNKKKK